MSHQFEHCHTHNLFMNSKEIQSSYFHTVTNIPLSLTHNPKQLLKFQFPHASLSDNILFVDYTGTYAYKRNGDFLWVYVLHIEHAIKNTIKDIQQDIKSILNHNESLVDEPVQYIYNIELQEQDSTPVVFPLTLTPKETKSFKISFATAMESIDSYVSIMCEDTPTFCVYSEKDPENSSVTQTTESHKTFIRIENGLAEYSVRVGNKTEQDITIPNLTWIVPETNRSNIIQRKLTCPSTLVKIEAVIDPVQSTIELYFPENIVPCEQINVYSSENDMLSLESCIFPGYSTRARWKYLPTQIPIEQQTFTFYDVRDILNNSFRSASGSPVFTFPY